MGCKKHNIAAEEMASSCGNFFAKYFILIVNSIFLGIATLFLIVGIWLAVDKNSFVSTVRLSSGETLHEFSEPTIIEQTAWVLMALGGFVSLITVVGDRGVAHQSKCLLSTYAFLLLLVLTVQISVAAFLTNYRSEADLSVREYLKESITRHYGEEGNISADTLLLNAIMKQFKCCGINGHEDFRSDLELWNTLFRRRIIPDTCCIPGFSSDSIYNIKYSICTDSTNQYYETGCYAALVVWINKNISIVLGVIISLIMLEVVLVIASFFLLYYIARNRRCAEYRNDLQIMYQE